MRISPRIPGICLSILLATPVLAQQSLFETPQDRTLSTFGTQPDAPQDATGAPARSGTDSVIPAPTFQDIRSPITTITNRPRPGAVPGARPTEPQRRAEPADIKDRNEFQDFVLQSTGRELPIFGADLFRNVPSTFAPADDIPVMPDYVIGPGDEIQIRAWGQIIVDYSAVVERNGTINVPRVGEINVAGIKANDLPSYLKTVFGRVFRNFQLTATLGKLRSMQIFVVGQAKRPGSYTVSSLSTLVTAVFAAGGPSSTGSMRSIQLKRNNRVVADLDLYDLLVSGDKSRDVQLLPGDVIYIAPVGPLVAVTGSVNAPAVYELRQNTPLFDLIRWAGGLATTAAGQKATVERIEDRTVRKVEDFPLDASGVARPLRDGDLVTVYSLVPRFDNAITLRGNVAQPGRLPWRDGLRVRDLIPEREALVSREYWLKRNQAVGLDDNVSTILRQQSAVGTRLTIQDLNQRRKPEGELDATVGDTIRRLQTEAEAVRFLNPRQASGAAPASRPQDAARLQDAARDDPARVEAAKADALRLVNQIKPSQREVNWDYAVVERLNRDDLGTTLIPFNLERAVIGGDLQHNVLLQPGDIITIFSKEDVQIPISKQTKYIRLEGEFNSSGVYQILPGETLRQLIVRGGGLSTNAYLFGAQFTRESTRIQQQKNLDESLNRLEREVQNLNIVRSQNVTTPEDAVSLRQQSENQAQLISRLRQIRPTGRIVLEVPEEGVLKDLPDLPLEDGDRFIVPSQPSMVSVFGSVYSENSFIYKPEKRVADYLAQAGGPTKNADKGSIYVLRADGSVISKQQAGYLLSSLEGARLMPGDSIVVPEELDRTTVTRALKDIATIFYQFGLGAAAVKVLRQ
jgi:polysaccharide export outer membrane protein